MSIRRPAVFLDRDGTLNELVTNQAGAPDSPRFPEDLVLCRQAAPFVRALNDLGYLCLVVTNQPGIAKGTLTPERLARVHEKLLVDLRRSGAAIDGIYYCPHHPEPGPGGREKFAISCACRKPAPGLLLEAAAEHHVDLRRSFMVGDSMRDVEAGRRAGVATILLAAEALEAEVRDAAAARGQHLPDRFVVDLNRALDIIVEEREKRTDTRN